MKLCVVVVFPDASSTAYSDTTIQTTHSNQRKAVGGSDEVPASMWPLQFNHQIIHSDYVRSLTSCILQPFARHSLYATCTYIIHCIAGLFALRKFRVREICYIMLTTLTSYNMDEKLARRYMHFPF